MTIRSLLLGILGAMTICGVTYFNDAVIRQTQFTGNNFPFSVYGVFLLAVVLINPALKRLRKSWAFSSAELAVILSLTLVGASIPGSSLMRSFTSTLIMPHRVMKTNAGWKQNKAVELLPEQMLADVSHDEERELNGFVLGNGDDFRFSDIPWSAWTRTLCFWLPLIVLLWFSLVGLSAVVHKQWYHHEHLPYPIARITESMLPDDEGETSSLFGNRMFWIGGGVVFAIHLLNYVHAWWPDHTVRFPTHFDFSALRNLSPVLERGSDLRLFKPHIYFTVFAIAYFLASDVSLSVGIGPWIYCLLIGILKTYALSLDGGGYYSIQTRSALQGGAYIGVLLMIIYTGRHYYKSVLKRAVGLRSVDEVSNSAKWGARIFMVCASLFVIDLIWIGLSWPFALAYTALIIGIFIVLSRILVETGLFHMNPFWSPGVLVVAFVGVRTVGPGTAAIFFTLSSVLLIEPRGSLMPYVVNMFGLFDRYKVCLGRAMPVIGTTLILGFAVAIPATLYFQYAKGANMADGWANRWIPQLALRDAVGIKRRLEAQGLSQEDVGSFKRITGNRRGQIFFAIGLACALICGAGRLRFSNWWIHPVLFLTWATGHARGLAASFLLAWLVKVLVTKWGGIKVYHELKPLMIGLIAGDLIAGLSMSIIGAVYYFVTGDAPYVHEIMMG